ncbi:hypothetical protein EV2_015251 [Malus domestica]
MDGTKKLRIKTFAVKSPRKIENIRPATSYVQYRCNVFGFANAMQLYRPMLQQRQDVINHLAETPFWSLIKFYMDDEIVATDRKKKSDMDLIKIIQCYDSKQQRFKFGDHEPKAITSEDVVQIFGLNNQGVELPNTDKSTKNMKDSFVKTYFAKQKIVKKKDIVEAYQKSVQDKTPEGAKATASIICVHLLQSLLFATSGTYISWSFITICGALDQISKYNWAKGVRDYLFKRINKSKKKRKNGEESATTSGCTALILYWICLHTNLVETISGRENMIPAIGRWDITKIHKAIRDIRVEEIEIGGGIPCSEEPIREHSNINQEECNAIPYPQQNNESSKKKEKKTPGRKRKRTEVGAEEDQSITINEAQLQFDQLYQEEFMKFDASYQKDFFGIDNTLGVEDFEKFKRCASMDQKRNIEKLLQERLEDKQKISSMNTEMIQLQLKNTAASMKVNKLLDEIGSLKKKLLENQGEDPDNDDQVEEHTHDKDTATEDPVQENATENDVAMEDPKQRHAIDHGPDENEEDQDHEGKDAATEKATSGDQPGVQMQTPTIKDAEKQEKETAKKKTRTLVKNIRRRDDRKPNVDPHYDYIPIQKKQKKAKYIYAVSDSESPSILPSESQPLDLIIEKGKEEPKVESPLNPIAKEIANKPAKKDAKKPVKRKLDKRYHLPASTRAYKLLADETKEKFKEYYRQEKMDYFWMQPRQGSIVNDLVVLKSDLTSLFVDGAIDANIIDASFYTMAENESKMRQQKNLYLHSFIFNDMEIEKSKSDQEHIDKTLQTVLQDNVDKVAKVFILIRHYFHFSLVVWDIKNGKMTHYNSKLPRVHGNTDLYFDHAVQVRDKIEGFYKYFKGDSNLTIDIERCLTCAQRKEDSLDCGIFVLQFATQVQEDKPVEATFEKEDVFAKRAQIATTLMNHKNSYANGLKKILEDRRQQNKHGQYDDIPDEDFITLA